MMMNITRKHLLLTVVLFSVLTPLLATDRGDEIRQEMWSTTNKNFLVTETPKKWANQSAIILAQLNRFEYRKPIISSTLRYNEYNHYRIKLLDKNSVDKYSEMTFYDNYGSVKVYVGFKVIKPNGKEIIIDMTKAVKMEKDVNGVKRAYNKLAIPGLEKGDILDYYICEEAGIASNSIIYFFTPVVFSLPREYPVVNHRLQFRAERRCFINLKSLNGAPELKLQTDEANEEQYYTLDVNDIESFNDQRWTYPYRELPTIKFRAAYASGKAMRYLDVLLGEPGKIKSSVSKKELQELAATMLATVYDVRMFSKFAKTKLKGVTDPFEIAKQSYYFYRNDFFGTAEGNLVEGNNEVPIGEIKFVDAFSTFLASKKIPHDIVIAAKRNITTIDNLLMENEIDWLIRVKKGNEYLYLAPFDMNSIPGEIDPLLQGTEAYALDGLLSPRKWDAKKITLPVTTKTENKTETTLTVQLENLAKAKVSVSKNIVGRNKAYEQNTFMDLYDFEKEERDRFKMGESFDGYSIYKKKYLAMKTAYMGKRATFKADALKDYLERNYDFKAKATSEVTIKQTGRYDNALAMIDEFSFESEDLIQKAGPNYLMDAGKLIESQVKIEGDELNRSTNIYFDCPRSYVFHITIDIPAGYTVQGLDKFNQQKENQYGGFTSKAKEQGGKIIIDTEKHYDGYSAPKDQWPSIVAFLNSANSFTEQKILFKKK